MNPIVIQAGKTRLKLRKSDSIIGIRKKSDIAAIEKKEVRSIRGNMGGFEVLELETKGEAMERALDNLRTNKSIEAGTHVYYSMMSDKMVVPTGDITIVFQPETNEEEQNIVLEEYHLKLKRREGTDKVVVTVTEASPNPFKVAMLLENISLVRLVEPDYDSELEMYDFSPPTGGLLEHLWFFKNTGKVADKNIFLKRGADAKIFDAWNRLGNSGSSEVTLAIVDNGLDISHPDLSSNIVAPFDYWRQSSDLKNSSKEYTHGTPCASIALARFNGSGTVGVAPNAKFLPLHGTTFSKEGTKQIFEHCVNNGADIISCSWGSVEPDQVLSPDKIAIIAKAAREGRNGKGTVILFAAGNEGINHINHYATHPDVIAVGASTSEDTHAFYSNQGMELDVVAPSNGGQWQPIAARASWDPGTSRLPFEKRYWWDGVNRSDKHKHFGGTSAATPLVAGVVALMLSANPNLTAKEVKQILCNTADKIGFPNDYINGHSPKYGFGRVNADKAVAEAIRLRDGISPPVAVEEGITSGRGIFRFEVSKQAPTGFGVQVNVFKEYGNVLIEAEKLQARFDAPVIVSINELNGDTVYKVILGAFEQIQAARNLHDEMQRKGVNGFIRNFKDL